MHPGANGQRLLLHAARGPAGQVVLDPEHLRGPDALTTAAAATETQEQNEKKKKIYRKERSSRKCNCTDGGSIFWFVNNFFTNIEISTLEEEEELDEEKTEEEEKCDLCRDEAELLFFCTSFSLCFSFNSTFNSGQRTKKPFSVFYFADILKILSVRHRVESHHEGKDGGGEKNGKKK